MYKSNLSKYCLSSVLEGIFGGGGAGRRGVNLDILYISFSPENKNVKLDLAVRLLHALFTTVPDLKTFISVAMRKILSYFILKRDNLTTVPADR